MRVISLLNQKGGVGKTSTCHHLAGAFSRLGLKVLLVDNDPQSSLTQGFCGPDLTRDLAVAETIAAVHGGHDPFPGRLIRPTGVEGVDLVPGSRSAASHNLPDPHTLGRDRQFALHDFLVAASGTYDLCLIDCPPNLHLCSWAALLASDYLVVPLQPEDYGAQGIADVQESIERATWVNTDLVLAGYLLTKVEPRQTLHKFYEERLRALYGPDVFDTRIPALAAFAEAIAHRRPVEQYKPRSPAATITRALADEFLARVGRPPGPPGGRPAAAGKGVA